MHTQRLILKSLDENDLPKEYLDWMNDTSITRFTESKGCTYKQCDLQNYVRSMNESKNNYLFAIYVKENDKYIGNIKVGSIDMYHQRADVGIIIGAKDEWGKGYATEAFRLAVSYAFERLGLYKVTAGAYANNIGSIKALRKAGFTECGKYLSQCKYENGRVDVLMFESFNKVNLSNNKQAES